MASHLAIIPVRYTQEEHDRVLKIEGVIEEFNRLKSVSNDKALSHPERFTAKQEFEQKFPKGNYQSVVATLFRPEDEFAADVHSAWGINYSSYRVLEFLVRETLVHDNDFHIHEATPTLAGPKSFLKGKREPHAIWNTITDYLDGRTMENSYYYGLQGIYIDKWNFVKKVELDFKKKMDDIDKAVQVLRAIDSDYADEQKEVLTKNLYEEVEEKIKVGKNALHNFVKIDPETRSIIVDYGKFVFFKRYALAIRMIYEPVIKAINGTDEINMKRFQQFIAQKWNLEIRNYVPGVKFTGDFVRQTLRSSKKQELITEQARSIYMSDELAEFFAEQLTFSRFEYPHLFGSKIRKIDKQSA